MILQSRGKMTASRLGEELEVSVRTVYRDIESLSAAGVPVFMEKGPGGGCVLMNGYRTSLTGLTPGEVKALFMLNVPESLDKLGVSDELRAAMRKLAAALPESRRNDEETVRQRVYLDWKDWPREDRPIPHLPALHRAVQENKQITMTFTEVIAGGDIQQFSKVVEPYGLVAKSGEWYLVCADKGRLRVYPVSRIIAVRAIGETFHRPVSFDLGTFWKDWYLEQEKGRTHYDVRVRVAPGLAALLKLYGEGPLRRAIREAGPPDAQGWVTTTFTYDSFWYARQSILNFGRDIEVLEPEPLRLSVIDFAKQIVDFYSEK